MLLELAFMKVVVIGNVSTGKTSFCRRYAYGEFTSNYKATVGVDFVARGDYQLWDIAGQERFGAVTKAYYRGAHGALVVVDSTCSKGAEHAQKWVDDFQTKYAVSVPIVVVANKSDLPRLVSVEDMDALCKAHQEIVGWIPCSVKNNENVEEAVELLTKHMQAPTILEDNDTLKEGFEEFIDLGGSDYDTKYFNKKCCV